MGTVEPRSDDVAGGCEPASEQGKSREGVHGGLGLEGSIARTHHNGEKNSDDVGDDVAAICVIQTAQVVQSKEEDMGMDISGANANHGYGLGDSDLKGVSSLLKMRGSLWQMNNPHGDKLDLSFSPAKTETDIATSGHNIQLLQENGDPQTENIKTSKGKTEVTSDISMSATNKEGEVDDARYDGYCFCVGDFVWGKIKSHPWWPGLIYDPADTSEYTSKLKSKNRHLVSYFGDDTFAWCHSSQLKPFQCNFEEMAKQSNSNTFVNAVQDAASEFGRDLESKMTAFLAEAHQNGSNQNLVQNFGIKEGVHVPETGSKKLATTMFAPAELLSRVREIAEVIAVTNFLELEIIKCHLSALYFFRGVDSLAASAYHEPKPQVGIEDTSDDGTEGTVNIALGLQIQEASDEHDPPKLDGTSQVIRKCPGSSDNGNHRKQKSIAEIMGEGESIDTRRKRIHSEKILENSSFSHDGGSGVEEGIYSGSLAVAKKRRRKVDSEVDTIETLVSSEGGQTDLSLKSENQIKEPLSRERKKSKYLSPPFTNVNMVRRKKKTEPDTPEVSKEKHPSQQHSTGLGQCSTTPSTFSDEVPQEVSELLPGCMPVDKPILQTPEQVQDQSQVIDLQSIKASSDDVLSEICYAVVNAPFARELGFSDEIENFIYTFRSFVYRKGSFYKVYMRNRPGKKRKFPESTAGSSQKDKNQSGETQSDVEPEKKRTKMAKSEAQKQKLPSPVKPSGMSDEGASPAGLFVTFGPGSSLPSKVDLINIYGKFGALNETETDIFYNNSCARVTFMKTTDAEEALKHSQSSSPFGTSQVSFHVEHSSSANKISECKGKSKLKSPLHDETADCDPKKSDLGAPISQSSQLLPMRQKLLTMNSMVQASEEEVSPTMKTRLEKEIKVLLEKVNAMVESSLASNT